MAYYYTGTDRPQIKAGFVLYALAVGAFLFSVLITTCIRTIGMHTAALTMQYKTRAAHSHLIVATAYHLWLIRDAYEQFFAQSKKEKALVVCKTPFEATLRCGAAIAWQVPASHQETLLCVTEIEGRCCRWTAHKEGESLVCSGYTFAAL